jgi:hypothetical protein
MAIVSNTQDSSKFGRHWIALFALNAQKVEVFDSLGHAPNACVRKFTSKFPEVWYNNECVQQSWSNACGIFALLYLIHRCRGLKREHIVSSLKHLPPLFVERLL